MPVSIIEDVNVCLEFSLGFFAGYKERDVYFCWKR